MSLEDQIQYANSSKSELLALFLNKGSTPITFDEMILKYLEFVKMFKNARLDQIPEFKNEERGLVSTDIYDEIASQQHPVIILYITYYFLISDGFTKSLNKKTALTSEQIDRILELLTPRNEPIANLIKDLYIYFNTDLKLSDTEIIVFINKLTEYVEILRTKFDHRLLFNNNDLIANILAVAIGRLMMLEYITES